MSRVVVMTASAFVAGLLANVYSSEGPIAITEKALAAWAARDAAGFETVAHPELLERCRNAEVI